MRALSSIALAALLLAPPASAAELDLSVRFQTDYSDNVFSDGDDEQDDVIFTLSPEGRIEQRNGEVRWEVGYKPSYVSYLDANGIDGFQHEFDGNARWQVTERTSIQVFERYSRLLSRSRFNQQITVEDEVVTEAELGVNDYERNTFSLSVNHLLDRGHSLRGQLSHSFTDFETSRDNQSLAVNLSYRYQLSPRSLLALGPRYSRQEVEGIGVLDDTSTDFYGITGTWQQLLARGLTLRLSAGPTWINADAGSDPTSGGGPEHPLTGFSGFNFFSVCSGDLFSSAACAPDVSVAPDFMGMQNFDSALVVEPGAPSREDTRLTFFADASIDKQWQRWAGTLSYRRQESPSSGLGSAAITDSVTGSVNWRPGPRWNLRWTATYVRRTEATESRTAALTVTPCVAGGDPMVDGCLFNAPAGTARSTGIRFLPIETDDRLDQMVGRFSVTYRLRERITLDGNLYYLDQSQSGDRFRETQDVSRFTAWIGIRWRLDPIPLPF